MTVDTFDCSIPEPAGTAISKKGKFLPFNPKWYSHKCKGAGVRYELGVNIQTGDVVWVNGPFACGKNNDPSIFNGGLGKLLDDGEMVEADGIYYGVKGCRSKREYFSECDKRSKSRARARHEAINNYFTRFHCLQHRWRHPLRKHKIAFAAVAVVVQISFESGFRPWQCYY